MTTATVSEHVAFRCDGCHAKELVWVGKFSLAAAVPHGENWGEIVRAVFERHKAVSPDCQIEGGKLSICMDPLGGRTKCFRLGGLAP